MIATAIGILYCRSAIEVLETELRESSIAFNLSTVEKALPEQQTAAAPDFLGQQEIDVVSSLLSTS